MLCRDTLSPPAFSAAMLPNTVVELVFKERPDDLITDQFVVVKGTVSFQCRRSFSFVLHISNKQNLQDEKIDTSSCCTL